MKFPLLKKKAPAGDGAQPPRSKYERLPLFAVVLYGLAGVSLILYIVMTQSVAFADWFNQGIGAGVRSALSLLTSWIPFSTGEAVILLLPLALFLVLRLAIRRYCSSWRAAFVYVGILLSVVATLFSAFTLGFAAGYRGSTLDQKLELDRAPVSAQDLYDTALILIDNINHEEEAVGFGADGFSRSPYTLSETNRLLNDAYGQTADEYDFITHVDSRVKPVLVSEVMSYMHITGVYSFFTGEANINVNFPDYTIPYTAAHEMAHQRGIAREDEANFMAFLVCIRSEDPYIRYCGYLNAYEYVASALYRADKDLYYDAAARLKGTVKAEMAAYSDFYDKYRDTTVSQVSGAVNDSYLQSQGTPGTVSYGMVVDLTVAYYKAQE